MSSQEDILRLNSDIDPEVLAHFIAATINEGSEVQIVIVDTEDATPPEPGKEEPSSL